MVLGWKLASLFISSNSKILSSRFAIVTPITSIPKGVRHIVFCSGSGISNSDNNIHNSMSLSSSSPKSKEDMDIVVTQGVDLEKFYGEETAKMYAGMMDDEMKKVIPDLQILLDTIPPPNDDGTILDTCVGSGHMLEWIYEKTKGKYPMHGIDLSTDMLNQARKRLSKSSTTGKTVVVLGQGNMLETNKLPLKPNSCVAILNTFALHHATPKQAERAIHDWSLLLKEGGCMYLGVWEGKGYMEEYPPGTKTLYHSEDDMKRWIESAGLQIIMSRTQVEEEMGNINTLYIICQKKK